MPEIRSQNIPPFEISSTLSDAYCVVRVAGELDIAHEDELREALTSACSWEQEGVIVDLTDCEFIDSSGVRSLLIGREVQAQNGGNSRLAVVTTNQQVLRILSVMGVDQSIPVHPTVEQAIDSLRG